MIISRTPFRISFFGGGTDYPIWYHEHGGAVLATTIDKYCYISCRYLPPFFEHKSRIAYSKIETVKSNQDIEHPAVRGVLDYLDIEDGVEIHHDGDLPARTGLGTSSSFTVGLLNAMRALKSNTSTRMQLARDAIKVEQDILKETVGCQDQVLAAHGGLSRIEFCQNDDIKITPIILNEHRLLEFQKHLILYFTGFSRTASEIAKEQVAKTKERKEVLKSMYQMVREGISILTGNHDLVDFGKLLDESWKLKQTLSSKISTPKIDEVYGLARRSGAIGGKLLGAGGGGFLLLFAHPEDHPSIRHALSSFLRVPFLFENSGTQIMLCKPTPLVTRDYPDTFKVKEVTSS